MVICLERGADLHMAQLMPLPLTVSCFSEIQIGFTFLVPAHLGSPGKEPLNVCVCVCVLMQCRRSAGVLTPSTRLPPLQRSVRRHVLPTAAAGSRCGGPRRCAAAAGLLRGRPARWTVVGSSPGPAVASPRQLRPHLPQRRHRRVHQQRSVQHTHTIYTDA